MGNLAAVNYDQPLRYYRRGKQSDSEFKKKFTDNFDVEKHINSIVSSVDTNGVMKEINNYKNNLRTYIIYNELFRIFEIEKIKILSFVDFAISRYLDNEKVVKIGQKIKNAANGIKRIDGKITKNTIKTLNKQLYDYSNLINDFFKILISISATKQGKVNFAQRIFEISEKGSVGKFDFLKVYNGINGAPKFRALVTNTTTGENKYFESIQELRTYVGGKFFMNPDALPAFTKFIFQSDSKVNLKKDNFTYKIQGMTDDFKIQVDDEVIYKTVLLGLFDAYAVAEEQYNFKEKIFIEGNRSEWEKFFRKIYSKNKIMNYAEENAQIWKKEIVETIKEKIKTLTNTSGLKGNTFELFFANILNDIAEDLEVKQMGQEKFQFDGKSKGEFSVDISLNYNDVNGIANTLGIQVKEGRSFLSGITVDDNKKIFTSTVYQEQNINGTFNSFMRFLDEQDWYVFADLLELKDLIQQKIDSYEKYFLMKMEAGQLRILTSNLYKVKSDSDIDIPIDSVNSLYYLSGKIVTASLLLSSRFITLEDKDNELGYYIVDPVSTFLYISNKKSPENINTENLVKLMKKVKFKRITKG